MDRRLPSQQIRTLGFHVRPGLPRVTVPGVPSQHRRFLLSCLLVLGLAWALGWTGYNLARHSRMTVDKVRTYVSSLDLSTLSGARRAEAIAELARRINALPLEERRRVRLEQAWRSWFDQMTEPEKSGFIEATLPSGFRQMLASFEQMNETNRRVAVDDGLKRLREARTALEREGGLPPWEGTNRPPEMSEELRQQAIRLGLKTYYSESSAQTKAELAPLLEEMQQMMESGRFLRGRRPPRAE